MQQTIFSQIIAGTIPCHKVYEDAKTLAFLDINPVQAGHTLVVSKLQAEFVWELPPEEYAAVMETVKKVAQRLKSVLNVPYVGEKIVGVDVQHAHVHVIPISAAADLDARPIEKVDHEALAALAKKLAF